MLAYSLIFVARFYDTRNYFCILKIFEESCWLCSNNTYLHQMFSRICFGSWYITEIVGHFLGTAGMDGLSPFGFLSPHGLTSNKSLWKRNQKEIFKLLVFATSDLLFSKCRFLITKLSVASDRVRTPEANRFIWHTFPLVWVRAGHVWFRY